MVCDPAEEGVWLVSKEATIVFWLLYVCCLIDRDIDCQRTKFMNRD